MNAKDAIRMTIASSDQIANMYLADLSDSDIMIRPVEGMNTIAWQLGHLIKSERHFIEELKPGSCPPLPAGFVEAHSKETSSSDDPKKFRSKAEYLALWKAQREATLKLFDGISEAELDAPAPESFRKWLPTNAALFNLVGVHPLMHCGQWVTVRRKLKKPLVM
jgi:uncharacterized damage-inducible protein DinB